MNEKQAQRLSKYLSLLLRHKPETLNLNMDKNGWVSVGELVEKINASGRTITQEDIANVVANCKKQRFKLDKEFDRIRANQGHSISVDVELVEKTPPSILYHGTAERNLDSIRKLGLIKGSRQHVHLSDNQDTARSVGRRYGKPVILEVDCQKMISDGHLFYQSENGVWLVDAVGAGYLVV